ncbi:SpaH/EbpB family LPXTG-anchored major pilin [Xylanimonas sp. McL0601]|uniref:SpaH/EbpB family LPXTG-anchored major pilin n=1 Tax=Xylanimonas sp. McL0601 TaxID=3414739 RepID=UPI003CEFC3DE
MNHRIRRVRNIGASALAVLTASALTVGLAAPTAAADPNPALPDASKTATLTIHKHETPAGAKGNGLETTVGSAAIEGVAFKAERIADIDLTTNEGWSEASAVTAATAAAMPKDRTASGTTNATGKIVFSNLDFGLYLVTETSTPAGIVPSAPFLVTLPLTHPTDLNGWLYDVHVYPKNDAVSISKTVDDTNAYKLNDVVTWKISADIPEVDPNRDGEIDADESGLLTAYKIDDVLDTKLKLMGGTSVALSGTTPDFEGATYLVNAVDYTVTGTTTHQVVFTPSGVAKLIQAKLLDPTNQVVMMVYTQVTAVGEIPNDATLYFNGMRVEAGEVINSKEVVTKFGGIVLKKQDADTSTPLSGAEFKVYKTEAEAKSGVNAIATTAATGSNGTLTIDGLRYSDWENGKELSSAREYWLVETKAPKGYELLAAPISFTVTSQVSEVTVPLTVKNVAHNAGFTLPLTGGSGTTTLTIAGVVILGAALVLMARSRRKAED